MQKVVRWVIINNGWGRAERRRAAALARHVFPKRTVRRVRK